MGGVVRIHRHKLNADLVRGYRLRWGWGSQIKAGGDVKFTDTS